MNPEQRTKGRPPKNGDGESRKMYYDSPLHALLVDRLPSFVSGGRIAVPALANALGYSTARVYLNLQNNRISVKFLLRLLRLADDLGSPSGKQLRAEDLLTFLLN